MSADEFQFGSYAYTVLLPRVRRAQKKGKPVVLSELELWMMCRAGGLPYGKKPGLLFGHPVKVKRP